MKQVFAIILVLIVTISGYFAYGLIGHEPLPEGLIQANGRIEGDHVSVASKLPGRVQSLMVREGDAVSAGQTLVQLDDAQTQAQVAQAEQAVRAVQAEVQAAQTVLHVFRKEVPLVIETAEANLAYARAVVTKTEAVETQARRDAQRYRALAEQDASPQHRREEADLALAVAQSELAVAHTAVLQAQKQLANARLGWERVKAKEDELAALTATFHQAEAALQEAQSILADLTIVAPSDGIITTRVVDLGEVVAAGAPLFDIVDLDRLYLKVYVPQLAIGKLRLQLPAQVYTDAFPDQPFAATVRYIASRAEFTPKEVQTPDERVKLVFAAKLYLDTNPDHRLSPGLPADAVIRWQADTPWTKPRW